MSEKDHEGNIYWKKFVEVVYHDLLHILKERRMKNASLTFDNDDIKEFKVTEQLNLDVLTNYANRIIERATFQIRKYCLKVIRRENTEIQVEERERKKLGSIDSKNDPNNILQDKAKMQGNGKLKSTVSKINEGILMIHSRNIKIIDDIFNSKNSIPEKILGECLVEVHVKQLTPLTGRDIEVQVYDENNNIICSPLALKMPSLSLGDEDLARGFAQEVDRQLVLWEKSETKDKKLGLLDIDWSHLNSNEIYL